MAFNINISLKGELARDLILWAYENLPDEKNKLYKASDIVIPPYSQQEIVNHLNHLIGAGYFKTDGHNKGVFSLSPEGYELAEIIRKRNMI